VPSVSDGGSQTAAAAVTKAFEKFEKRKGNTG
jgi:hypothetical protein